jgi:hypothetical protein
MLREHIAIAVGIDEYHAMSSVMTGIQLEEMAAPLNARLRLDFATTIIIIIRPLVNVHLVHITAYIAIHLELAKYVKIDSQYQEAAQLLVAFKLIRMS